MIADDETPTSPAEETPDEARATSKHAAAWRAAAATYGAGAAAPAPAVPAPYVYNALVISVHDGDTINVAWDWGFRRYDNPQPIRLLGCNAAELSAVAPDGTRPGVAARDNLAALLPPGTPLVLTTAAPDKYAPRVDAAVSYRSTLDGTVRDLVADLIAGQWVAAWDGTGEAPVPPWPRTVP